MEGHGSVHRRPLEAVRGEPSLGSSPPSYGTERTRPTSKPVLSRGRPGALRGRPGRTAGRSDRGHRESCPQSPPPRSRGVLRLLRVRRRRGGGRPPSRRSRAVAARARTLAWTGSGQSVHEMYRLLLDPYWTETERLAVLDTIELEDVLDFAPRLFESVKVRVLAHGDVSGEAAASRER